MRGTHTVLSFGVVSRSSKTNIQSCIYFYFSPRKQNRLQSVSENLALWSVLERTRQEATLDWQLKVGLA
jgi:hypothetical protein